jgi:uncharacterized membrane protein YidH (DUF202 family)
MLIAFTSVVSAPVVFAQTRTLRSIAGSIVELLGDLVMPLLFILALSWFIWGTIEFIRNSDNQEKRKEGRRRMLWGIIALFVMVAFLGITSIFTETFFNRQPSLPQLYEEAN